MTVWIALLILLGTVGALLLFAGCLLISRPNVRMMLLMNVRSFIRERPMDSVCLLVLFTS